MATVQVFSGGAWLPAKPLPPVLPVNATPPTIIGIPQVGQTVTVDVGTWNNSPSQFSIQYVRVDANGLNPVNIGSPRSSLSPATIPYRLASAEQALRIRADVTAINSSGGAMSSTSPSGIIAAAVPPFSFLVGVSGTNDGGTGTDVNNADAWLVGYESWLSGGAAPGAGGWVPVSVRRQFANNGFFGAGDTNWDPAGDPAGSAVPVAGCLQRAGRWVARTGSWPADPAGVVRRMLFTIDPGFVTGSNWFSSLVTPPSAVGVYNDPVRFYTAQAWDTLANGASHANKPPHCTYDGDTAVENMCTSLFNYGLSNSIIQPYHESYGGWHAFEWGPDVANYIKWWQRMVTLWRAREDALGVPSASRAWFAWPFYRSLLPVNDPNLGFYSRYLTATGGHAAGDIVQAVDAYPGDAYVQALAPNFSASVIAATGTIGSEDWTLAGMLEAESFAAAHGNLALLNVEWSAGYDNTNQIAAPDTGVPSVTDWITRGMDRHVKGGWYSALWFESIVGGPPPAQGKVNEKLQPSTSYPTASDTYRQLLGFAPQAPAGTLVVNVADTSQPALLRGERSHNRILTAQNVSPRNDSCGTTSGSAVVTDASAAAGDVWRLVTGAGVPASTYVVSVVAGVSFTMSKNATATATATLTIGSKDRGRLAALGTTGERVFCRGHWSNPNSAGVYDFANMSGNGRFGYSDANMAEQVARGVHPLICIYGVPAWNRPVPTTRTATVSITNGSTFVADSGAASYDVGRGVTGAGMQGGTTVSSVNPGVSFTLSKTATATQSTTLTIATPRPYDSPCTSYAAWTTMVYDHIRHFKEQDPAWTLLESYNEPDLTLTNFTFTTAMQFWDAFYDAVHQANIDMAAGAWAPTVPAISPPVKLIGIVQKGNDTSYLRNFLTHAKTVGKLPHKISFHLYADDPATYASAVAAMRAVTVETSFAGTFAGIEILMTEWGTNTVDNQTFSSSAPVAGQNGLADNAAYWAGVQYQQAAAALVDQHYFAQIQYNAYPASVLVADQVAGSYNPGGADGDVYAIWNVMRFFAQLPAQRVASDCAFTNLGHGLGTVAAADASSVVIVVWYHRQPGVAWSGAGAPQFFQVNSLPAALRSPGRSTLTVQRWLVNEDYGNYAVGAAKQDALRLPDLTVAAPAAHLLGLQINASMQPSPALSPAPVFPAQYSAMLVKIV